MSLYKFFLGRPKFRPNSTEPDSNIFLIKKTFFITQFMQRVISFLPNS